jgi:hypothetical protein
MGKLGVWVRATARTRYWSWATFSVSVIDGIIHFFG